ncbi:MAG: ATP-binding protein, partial [Chthoniobacter sp.]
AVSQFMEKVVFLFTEFDGNNGASFSRHAGAYISTCIYVQDLTDRTLDLITILEADATIRFESRSIERELGHAPAHYRGRNAFEFVHPEDCPAVMKAFQEALEQHGNTPVIRFRFRHADGSYRTLEGSGNNLLNDPVVCGIVFNSRDITETVKLQEKVERAREEKEDTIARLTGGVAHDVNNMLTAVQGLAELAEQSVPVGSSEAGYLGDIQMAVRRGANLTGQLLAFSRRAVLQPKAIELSAWLRDFRLLLRGVLGPRVGLTLESRSHLRIWEDPVQFEKVLIQLATNAREAMPMGGHLTIEAFPTTLGANECPADGREGLVRYVKLSVADNGIGMNAATMERIFEPFFTTKTDGQHSGLGLSMCRGIVEQSGGHITVRSIEGHGTVFNLFLPSVEAAERERARATPPAAAIVPRAGKPTILFVDDEMPLREIGGAALRHAGFEVLLAEDGPSALARLANLGDAPLDLLVTDVIMPGMTGVQLAEEVMRRRPGTPVLLCSGYTRDALVQSGGLPEGMTFLPKPYTLADLLGSMRQRLGVTTS